MNEINLIYPARFLQNKDVFFLGFFFLWLFFFLSESRLELELAMDLQVDRKSEMYSEKQHSIEKNANISNTNTG